jgi:TonB family protein
MPSRAPFLAAASVSFVAHLVVAIALSGAGKASPHRTGMRPFDVTILDSRVPEPLAKPNAPQAHAGAAPAPAVPKLAPAALPVSPEQALSRSSVGGSFSGLEAPDLTYYGTRQLDVYPTLAAALDLRYGDSAAAAGITGHALILVLIDATGSVDDVKVVEAEPAGYFESDVREAFMTARFTPGTRNGRSVRSRVLVRVSYGGDQGER